MSKRSKRWLQDHERDVFVRQARQSHYRSRAVYKLQELDRQYRLLRPGLTVVDLGAAPGSWTQFVAERTGSGGRVVAVDLLPMEAVTNATIIEGDFSEQQTLDACIECLPGGHADLVISDMAPNISGIRTTDQSRSMHLAELVFDFSTRVLNSGGNMLVKLFQGAGTEEYKRKLVKNFQRVIVKKPRASRQESREFYILAMGYDV